MNITQQNNMNEKVLLNVKEFCEYLGIGQTRERVA